MGPAMLAAMAGGGGGVGGGVGGDSAPISSNARTGDSTTHAANGWSFAPSGPAPSNPWQPLISAAAILAGVLVVGVVLAKLR